MPYRSCQTAAQRIIHGFKRETRVLNTMLAGEDGLDQGLTGPRSGQHGGPKAGPNSVTNEGNSVNRDFGDAMRRIRKERGLTVGDLAGMVSYDRGALGRFERGARLPTPHVTELIDTALEAEGNLVRLAEHSRSTESSTGVPEDDLTIAARESVEFADWVTATNGRLAIDQIADELRGIGCQFVTDAPLPLVRRLRTLRGEVRAALQAAPSPSLTRELLLLGGITVDLLAHVTENLGNARAAEHHARAAEEIAIQLHHPALQARARGTRALIWEWDGRPNEAMRLAANATSMAPVGEQQARLAAIEARCAARVGQAEAAQKAIARSIEAAEVASTDELTVIGGVLRFPPSKMAYYLGSTHRLLGTFEYAQRWALNAISAYECGPPTDRSYGDEALARADVAIARIDSGELDGAAEILAPVLELPSDQRIQPITGGLHAVARALARTQYATDKLTIELNEEITMLTASRRPR